MVNDATYKGTLVQFMNHRDSPQIPYNKHSVFSREELAAISPEEIVRWFKEKVYGNADADSDVDLPVEGRHSSLLFYKKAISHFIPNMSS